MSSVFNPPFSNKCLFCVKSKKKCDYYGMPGEFLCNRCINKEECRFLCEGCYESIRSGNLLDLCSDCKMATKKPPETYDFAMTMDVPKLYLSIERSKCNHKIEITPNQVARLYATYIKPFSNSSGLSEVVMVPTPTLPVSSTLSPQPNDFVLSADLPNMPPYTHDPRLDIYNPMSLQYYNLNILPLDGHYQQGVWYQSFNG
ncbi:3618_t:CDS:2 [Cetraspora pellucida]|uniref:3618_t:CDS:1 n=1 Tax=Cetraspora pellucida TaxID=1433469 RepID=A0A9N9B3L4_9GLOM|nr:3618_t:CDS:2 [Cetraspora pellucida]